MNEQQRIAFEAARKALRELDKAYSFDQTILLHQEKVAQAYMEMLEALCDPPFMQIACAIARLEALAHGEGLSSKMDKF